MSDSLFILNRRYGDIFLSKSRNIKIVSGEQGAQSFNNYSEYNALLDTGAINPTVIVALVKGDGPEGGAHLKDLNWSSLHVRSYNSWEQLISTGITLKDTEPQKLVSASSSEVKDVKMNSIEDGKNYKVYTFQDSNNAKITLFTSKPVIATGGNDLPRKTTLLPWLAESNFVYEKVGA